MFSNRKSPIRLISLLFFLSGGTSLLYEVVWARQLQHFFGSTTFAVSAILTSFLGGLALGSYLFGRLGRRRNPTRLYGGMEALIGLYAFAFPIFIKLSNKLYLFLAPDLPQPFLLGQATKFLFAFGVLAAPCVLMGGTLPVLIRAVEGEGNASSVVGRLYAVNMFGAVCGAAVTGFFLIETFGLTRTVFIGGGVNLIIALAAFFVPAVAPTRFGSRTFEVDARNPVRFRLPFAAYAISGFCALSYEILWVRSLVHTLWSSTYTFSTILVLFLLGSASGAALCTRLVPRIKTPAVWFAAVQILIAAFVLFSIKLAGFEPGFSELMTKGWWGLVTLVGIKTGFLLLLPSILFGSLFPITAAWVSERTSELSRAVGNVYAINTFGAILGAFCAGFLMLPGFGLRNSLLVLIAVNLTLGIFLFWHRFRTVGLARVLQVSFAGVAIFAVAVFSLTRSELAPPIPPDFKRVFFKDGPVANVAVYQCTAPGRDFKILKVNGVYQSGGTDKGAMRVQRRQGHLPMLLHGQPDSVLVIGLATGVTLSAVAEHPVKRIDCVEIVPSQVEAATFFARENQDVLTDPRVKVVVDDGRSFIQSTDRQYDVIIGDLFQVRSAGAGNLYSADHVQACRRRLRPGGLMVQWLPVQQFSEGDLKTVLRTFTSVFPFVQLWLCDSNPEKPVLALLASEGVVALNVRKIEQRSTNSGASTLESVGYDNPFFVVSQCIMQTESVKRYAGAGPLNTYDRPIIEFSAPKTQLQKDQLSRRILAGLLDAKSRSQIQLEWAAEEGLEKMKWYNAAQTAQVVAELAGAMQQWERSEMVLEGVLDQTPEHPDIRRLLGHSKVYLAIKLLKRAQPAHALQKLRTAMELGIDDPLVSRLVDVGQKMMKGETTGLIEETPALGER